jgi:hypothetical protein
VLIVREEWNMTAAMLTAYWSNLRSTEPDPDARRAMPLRSPALAATEVLDFAGRSAGLFDLLIAQRMSARVFNGNADLRENFMIRLLARYTVQTWKMLIPHLKHMRRPTDLGRWVVAAGDAAQYVQGLLISDEEARMFATSGMAPAASPWALSTGRAHQSPPGTEEVEASTTLEDQLRPVAAGHHPEQPAIIAYRLMRLVDIATTLEYLGITHAILKKAARADGQGDATFPQARGGGKFSGYLYDLHEVTDWAKRKRAAEAARAEARKVAG